jgi:glutamine amidotransferase
MAGNTIAVIDYGMGNLRSVSKALERVAGDKQVIVTADPALVAAAERVVFPGQGAMPDCMRELEERGLRPAVIAAAKEKPFLGICIGLQMLFEHSEEGNVAGLGVFAGDVRHFPDAQMVGPDGLRLKVPHMGWNQVQQQRHALWGDIEEGARFYFVHSYCVQPADANVVMGTTEYGIPFTCAVGRDNIFAVQFHPEKSAQDGLQLLKNFVEWQP